MFPTPILDSRAGVPLYRQLYGHIKGCIDSGSLRRGEKLPPTRELAGLLGLNRTTVSAAYALLEAEGLIRGHVGRGSFVEGAVPPEPDNVRWEEVLDPAEDSPAAPPEPPGIISFATSRPSEALFPLDDFRATCREVLEGPQASAILQLGSPFGYAPLRRFLLEEARQAGVASPADDCIITSGCQQGMDLLQRVLIHAGDTVLLEDPVYPGLKNLFSHAGARLAGVPVGAWGIDPEHLDRLLAREKPRLLVVTSDFQNPTGATLPEAARRAILLSARQARAVLVENDIYGDLRYSGAPVPTIKQMDAAGGTVLLRSFSKLAFPGLRVGWAIGPRALIARMAEVKQMTDLHTDQLSQAVMLRFAESGRLAAHRARVLAAGAERLAATLAACERFLPEGSRWTRPQGGMNLWVTLPEPLDAGALLPAAQRAGASYLPGRFFTVSRHQPGGMRLSFAGLAPEKITEGIAILGEVFADALRQAPVPRRTEPAPAMV